VDKGNIFGICGDGVMMVRIETGEEDVICFGLEFCESAIEAEKPWWAKGSKEERIKESSNA
jgi:hypothetical protein